MTDPISTPCPHCGEDAAGNYCDLCGGALGSRFCSGCGTAAVPGARFCAGCGAPYATAAGPGAAIREPRTPWMVAGALIVMAIALILWAAGQRGDGQAPGVTAAAGATPAGTPPDLSTMTPREQFTRLNDRIMTAAQGGDSATVIRFWPMAAQAYTNLLPGDLDVDARYHMATLHLIVGQLPEALALADTMMAESPDNLLGWYLRAVVADLRGDTAEARTANDAFLAHYDAEIATGRQEYVDHADLLTDYRSQASSR